MKSFGTYIKEDIDKNVMWRADELHIALGGNMMIGDVPIPLSSAMINKIFGKEKLGYYLHVTDAEGLVGVYKNQNRRNALSVASFFDDLTHGVHRNGVVILLKGKVLISKKTDIMSIPDKGGRRWVAAGNVFNTIHSVRQNLYSARQEWFLKIMKDVVIPFHQQKILDQDRDYADTIVARQIDLYIGKSDFEKKDLNPFDTTVSVWDFIRSYFKPIKHKIVKSYIDMVNSFLLKNLEAVKLGLKRESSHNNRFVGWDEFVLTNYKIEDVLFSSVAESEELLSRYYDTAVKVMKQTSTDKDPDVWILNQRASSSINGRVKKEWGDKVGKHWNKEI